MFKVFDLKTHVTEKGALTPMELDDFIDFEVKRVYTVHQNKDERGGHCHLEEEEFFFMAAGSCLCRIHDGNQWTEVHLKANKQAIWVANKVWHEFVGFSEDGVLVALSSTNYNPERVDYIEDFDEFLNHVNV